MTSLKRIPSFGKSGTSRILSREIESHETRSETLRRSRRNRSCESSCATPASASRSSNAALRRSGLRDRSPGATSCSTRAACRPAAVRIVRRWRRVDAEARETGRRGCDVRLALPVASLAVLDARDDDAVLLELAQEVGRDGRAFEKLRAVDLVLGTGQPDVPAARAVGRCTRAVELLPDHAKRQELVALKAEDLHEPLDVVRGEEPVATTSALGRDQPLVLEVADLRHRDVRKLLAELVADGADRAQRLSRRLGASPSRHQRCHRSVVIV